MVDRLNDDEVRCRPTQHLCNTRTPEVRRSRNPPPPPTDRKINLHFDTQRASIFSAYKMLKIAGQRPDPLQKAIVDV